MNNLNSILLAIDPGKHHSGYAIFARDALVCAGVVKMPKTSMSDGPKYRVDLDTVSSQNGLAIATRVTQELANVVRARGMTGYAIEIVTEFMHVYGGTGFKPRKRVDPEDLLFCQQTAGAIAGAVTVGIAPARLRCVEAKTWKGQQSDEATWTMIRKAMTLEDIEIAMRFGVYSDEGILGKGFHHGLEAVGIGLWALWRI